MEVERFFIIKLLVIWIFRHLKTEKYHGSVLCSILNNIIIELSGKIEISVELIVFYCVARLYIMFKEPDQESEKQFKFPCAFRERRDFMIEIQWRILQYR